MSVTTYCSIEEVFARLVRNTRLIDAEYLVDAEEWVPEAMDYMRTKMALVPRWKDVHIKYHKGRMPCGIVTLTAVQYKGCRLRYHDQVVPGGTSQSANTGTVPSVHPGIPLEGTSIFGSHIVKRPSVDEGVDVLYYETDLQKIYSLPYDLAHWYFTELGYFNTSFADGCIRVFFRGMPLDDKELPLIPDDGFYKEALYWYCRAKMIGAGYKDKVFSEEVCMTRYEVNAERAMARITYPTVDEMDSRIDMVRLILPSDYWSTYFNPAPENLLF